MPPKQTAEDLAGEWADPKTLQPWPRNPRKTDPKQIARVQKSIMELGFGAPIVARRETREVIAGHTRLAAAKKLKLARVPVRFVDVDEATAHKLALADNKLAEHGEWDDGELEAQLAQLDEDTKDLLGFLRETDAELDDPKDDDSSPQLDGLSYRVVVDCRDEMHQTELLDRLEQEGLKCRPLIS